MTKEDIKYQIEIKKYEFELKYQKDFRALILWGAGLLIVVGVVKETFFNLETELKVRGYDDSLLVR